MLIKMQPSESAIHPDLTLSFSDKFMKENRSSIKEIKKGDQVLFKAEIRALGDEFKMHHLHGISVTKTGDNMNLTDIIVNEAKIPVSMH
jgi:hypothetical protein